MSMEATDSMIQDRFASPRDPLSPVLTLLVVTLTRLPPLRLHHPQELLNGINFGLKFRIWRLG